jgi:LysM repeat protein
MLPHAAYPAGKRDEYIIQAGDTLNKIAGRFQVSVN